MNMTIVIVGKRSMELVLVLALCGLALAGAAAAADQLDELPRTTQAVASEDRVLDEHQLELITKDLGKYFSDTMSSEMEHLLADMEGKQESKRQAASKQKHHQARLNAAQLEQLKSANQEASEAIRARIELVGDNSGKLPQMSLGGAANSLLTVASGRLASAGSFIGTKMRSLGASLSDRLPPKLKRLLRWPSFLTFKVRFHKRYSSMREELYRNFVFLKNQIVVNMQHIRFMMRRDSHVLGQTQYSDQTETEYRDLVGNNEAADDPMGKFEKGAAKHAQLVSGLKALAAANKTVHGQPIPKDARPDKKARRSKRSVTAEAEEDDDDELNESEDDDVFDEAAFGLKKPAAAGSDNSAADDGDGDDDDDLETYELVDEFAGDVDLSELDNTIKDLDEAIEPVHFEPVDLRQTGCMITPENQNNCGCCYAHVVTALASYHECMGQEGEKGPPRRFHARFVSDCGRYIAPEELSPLWVKGCAGGRASKALEFVQTVGIPLFMFFNYAQLGAGLFNPLPPEEAAKQRGPRDECPFKRPKDIANPDHWPIQLVEFEFLKRAQATKLDISEVNLHLRTVGPVLVSVRMWPSFKDYAAGVYDRMEEPVNGRVDLHSMLVVGHEYDHQGREIYIIWNSHGPAWGERGYLKITAEALNFYAIMFVGTLPDEVDE